jgi:hypothetical protein
MGWDKVREAIVDYAPLAGSLLLPMGGGAIGTLIASVLDVKDEPDAILEAIKNDPNAVLKLRQWEIENKTEIHKLKFAAETRRIEEETKQKRTVNETMIAEAKSDHWWTSGWRPYWGFISGTAFFVVVCAICYFVILAIKTKDSNLLLVLPQVVMAIAALFSIPGAILGVSAWHRGKMQRIQAGELPGKGIINNVIEKLKKR